MSTNEEDHSGPSPEDTSTGNKRSRYQSLFRLRKRRKDFKPDGESDASNETDSSADDNVLPTVAPVGEQMCMAVGEAKQASDNDISRSGSEVQDNGSSDSQRNSDNDVGELSGSELGTRDSDIDSISTRDSDMDSINSEIDGNIGVGDQIDMAGAPQEDIVQGNSSDSDTGSNSENSDASDSASSDDEADGSEYGEEEEEGDAALYPGAPLSLHESLLSILTLSTVHHLTGQCIADILQLISLHCIPNNLCVKTLHKFKKFFSLIGKAHLIFHYFCSGCFCPLESKEAHCETCEDHKVSFFIQIPLLSQLQTMYSRPDFYQDLKYRFQRQKENDLNIEDIYDGNVYKNEINNGFLRDQQNISLMWYTDGISIYRSSKFSIWPLFYAINELKYKKRVLKENIIMAGLWFGPKPKPNLFLKPFHTELRTLSEEGFLLQVPNAGQVRVKGKLLCGVCDLPAKSSFFAFHQWNGSYGCTSCKAEGFQIEPSVRVYPYSENLIMRNNEEVLDYAQQALVLRQTDPKASVFGVKGPSLLYAMVPDMVMSTGIDVMHGVFIGLAKLLTSLWFDSSHSMNPFSLSQMTHVIDSRLRSIKPPSTVQRITRSIGSIALWKASEFKSWFFFYSIPVLLGILDVDYLHHHCEVVSAVSLLSQRSISLEQIRVAETLLHSYVSNFQRLYGLRYMGINVHQLLHLPSVVVNLGPLWVYSCFSWEDLNGKIARLVHGTRHAGMQICSAATVYMNLNTMIDSLPENSAVRSFCKNLNKLERSVKIADNISEGVYAVGTYSQIEHGPVHDQTFRALQTSFAITHGNCSYFYRLKKKGVIYVSAEYKRATQRESSFAEVYINHAPQLCRIERFVRWTNCDLACNVPNCQVCPARFFCIVVLYQREPWFAHDIPNVRLLHLAKVTITDTVVAVPVDSLKTVCFYIKVDDGNEFIARPVNDLEVE